MRPSAAFTVTIDGPAGAGKSTVAKRVAQALGFVLVDTGAIYRSVALLAQRQGVAWDDEAGLGQIAHGLSIRFMFADGVNRIFLGDEDVTAAIRTRSISHAAAKVSAHPCVREGLLHMQRHLAGQHSAVLEGRDIGTVVCPTAQVKIFLYASLDARARRRLEELQARGEAADVAEVTAEIHARDRLDTERVRAPLRAAPDALQLDSTAMSVDEVIAAILAAVARYRDGSHAPDPSDVQANVGHFMTMVLAARMAERPEVVSRIHATFDIVVTGPGGGRWQLDLRVPGGRIVRSADADTAAPCILELAAADLHELATGRTNLQTVFLAGRLNMTGDAHLALQLSALFD